jgi:hypothetical protein
MTKMSVLSSLIRNNYSEQKVKIYLKHEKNQSAKLKASSSRVEEKSTAQSTETAFVPISPRINRPSRKLNRIYI